MYKPQLLATFAFSLQLMVALSIISQPAYAQDTTATQLPPMTTIGQLADAEETTLAESVPRNFPIPATSHNLDASNAIPFASVSGGPETTADFYGVVLPAMGWTIKDKVLLPAIVSFVACKGGQCVNIGSGHGNASDKPTEIDFQFFPASVYSKYH